MKHTRIACGVGVQQDPTVKQEPGIALVLDGTPCNEGFAPHAHGGLVGVRPTHAQRAGIEAASTTPRPSFAPRACGGLAPSQKESEEERVHPTCMRRIGGADPLLASPVPFAPRACGSLVVAHRVPCACPTRTGAWGWGWYGIW